MRQCCDRELRAIVKTMSCITSIQSKVTNQSITCDQAFFKVLQQQKRREKEKDRLISVYFGFLTQLSLPTSERGALPYMRAIQVCMTQRVWASHPSLDMGIQIYRYLSHFFVIIEEKINKSALQFGFTVSIVSSTNYPVIGMLRLIDSTRNCK